MLKRSFRLAPFFFLLALLAPAGDLAAQDLSSSGWRMSPDTTASWTGDTVYLPGQFILANLPVNPPSGGWNVLNNSQGIPVTLPGSVEQYYWAAFGGTSLTGDYQGVAWWWRTFTAPVLQPGQRLMIQFRGARLRAEVYCNHKLCAYNIINEVPFAADITSVVQQGATTNQLAIRLTSPGGDLAWGDWGTLSWGTNGIPNSRGICGLDEGVILQVCDPVCVSDFAVLNQTNPQAVWLVGAVTNTSASAYNGPVNFTIQDSNAVPVWQGTNILSIPAGGQAGFTNMVVVTNATLWDITNPVLYAASAVVPGYTNSGTSVNFGFRWFSPVGIGTNAMLQLNGHRIVVRSAISWGWWAPDGLFPTDAMARKEVTAAQTLGLNCLQFHRNLGYQNVFDQQDQLGLLRYEEPGNGEATFGSNFSSSVIVPTNFSGAGGAPANFQQQYEVDKILGMVRRDRSHPSLVVYDIQNEIQPCLTNAYIFWLFQQIRQIDPSRTVCLHSGIGAGNQLLMLPYSTNFLYENGNGYSGWNDQHTVGGPGNYQDNLYTDANNYANNSSNTSVIVVWGEMFGVGMPDDHQAIVDWYRTNGVYSTGYDLLLHEQVLAGYNNFLDSWNFRTAFPTASSLFYEIGKKSYFFWQKIMENSRMCDRNDFLVMSGWESTIGDNHSGLVDSHRNFRTDPGILKQAMNPEVLVVRPKRFVVKPGETAVVDVHLINETGRAGAQTLTLTALNPDGSVLFNQQKPVTAVGGNVFGQFLATNFTFVPTQAGTVRVEGMLQPAGGNGDVLTNETDMLVVDPVAGSPVMTRVAVCEASNQINTALSNIFKIAPLDVSHVGDSSLQAVVLGLGSSANWAYQTYTVQNNISNTLDPGLFQNQMFGQTGTVGSWFGFAPGNITVQLEFAETFFSTPNSRLFDVAINGTTVLSNFDTFTQAGGQYTALTKTFTVYSTNGEITLSFPKVAVNNAQIAGLRMTDASNNVTAVAFSTASYTDHTGLVWQAYPASLVPQLPMTDAQWQTMLGNVTTNGVRLVLWPNTMSEVMAVVNKLAAAGILSVGSSASYTGFLPDNGPPWMGSWYFARPHWLLDSLPVNSVLGWQYQIPHGTGDGGGLLLNPMPGHPMDVMIGFGLDHQTAVGIGDCVIQCGRGLIVLPALPHLRDALSITNGGIITQPVSQRMLGNALRAMPSSAPSCPPSLTATPGNRQVILNWADAFGATGYNVKRAAVSGGPYTLIASNVPATVYTDSGRANGTYYYVVSAVNSLGESLNSPEAAVLLQPATLCAIKAQVNSHYATANGTNLLIASQSGISPTEQFAEVGLSGGQTALQSLANGLFVTVIPGSLNLSAASSNIGPYQTFAITNIGNGNVAFSAGINQCYVSADNYGANPLVANRTAIGSWETFSLTPLVSAAPSGLAAIAGDSQVVNNWNGATGATGYNLKRAPSVNGSYAIIASNLPATSYTDFGLTNGVACFYAVSAVSAAGESTNSAAVSATPMAGPLALNVAAFSGGTITLAWTNGAVNLYYAPQIAPPVQWTLLTDSPAVSSGQWTISLPLSTNASGFYRLQQRL